MRMRKYPDHRIRKIREWPNINKIPHWRDYFIYTLRFSIAKVNQKWSNINVSNGLILRKEIENKFWIHEGEWWIGAQKICMPGIAWAILKVPPYTIHTMRKCLLEWKLIVPKLSFLACAWVFKCSLVIWYVLTCTMFLAAFLILVNLCRSKLWNLALRNRVSWERNYNKHQVISTGLPWAFGSMSMGSVNVLHNRGYSIYSTFALSCYAQGCQICAADSLESETDNIASKYMIHRVIFR